MHAYGVNYTSSAMRESFLFKSMALQIFVCGHLSKTQELLELLLLLLFFSICLISSLKEIAGKNSP